MSEPTEETEPAAEERWSVLRELEEWLETPMLVLSFIWLMLVVVELGWRASHTLEVFGTVIWIIFIVEFAVRLTVAPDRASFLRRNALTILALIAPALRLLRVLRFLRFARAARGMRLVRIVGTANRSMKALRSSLSRRGLGYVLLSTVFVVLLGAGGMLAFEPASEVESGFVGYGDALWWTAMLMTSIGSDFWPSTLEGRILCFLLSVYGFAVFGYITASFASFFVGRDAAAPDSETVGSADAAAIRSELAALRAELGAKK